MANAWIEYVKKYRAKNPSLSYKEALMKASKQYKPKAKPSRPMKPKKTVQRN